MMLKPKHQYFSHLVRRVDSLEKTDAGRDRGQEEKGKILYQLMSMLCIALSAIILL